MNQTQKQRITQLEEQVRRLEAANAHLAKLASGASIRYPGNTYRGTLVATTCTACGNLLGCTPDGYYWCSFCQRFR